MWEQATFLQCSTDVSENRLHRSSKALLNFPRNTRWCTGDFGILKIELPTEVHDRMILKIYEIRIVLPSKLVALPGAPSNVFQLFCESSFRFFTSHQMVHEASILAKFWPIPSLGLINQLL